MPTYLTIDELTATASAASGDFLPIWRTANGDTRKITKANFMGGVLTGGGTIATGGFTLTLTGTATINGTQDGSMTGGGTVATGGYTLTIPKTGTAAVGTGTAGRIAEWVTDANTLQASTLIKSGAGVLTLSAGGTYTFTVPATGTAALLGEAQTFTGAKAFTAGMSISGGTIEFDPGSGADATRALNFNIAGINYGKILIPSGSGGALAFHAGASGAVAERFRINPSGEINAVPTANIKPVYVIIADNGTENLSTWTTSTNTVLLVHDATAARAALFMVRSTVNEVVELAGDTSGRFTTTFDNASTINVTYSSGYKIQNKTGSSVTIGVLAVHS